MLKVAVCDDEKQVVNQIEEAISEICAQREIPVDTDGFYDGKSLEKEITNGTKYDLIYLDIQMKNGDGISTAKKIRKIDDNVLLIYVSSYDRYMMDLFQLDVFAFIKKPIDNTVFIRTFIAAHKKVCNKLFYFTFHYKNKEFKVPCKEILYFESNGRKINIFYEDGNCDTFNAKLSDVEKKVFCGKIPFLRIHQSYLVNYYYIKARSRTEIELFNGKKLPISEDRQKKFSYQYTRLLGGEIDG